MKNDINSITGGRRPGLSIRTTVAACALGVVLLTLSVAPSGAWAQGLPLRTCPGGTTAYLCQGDIVVADRSAGPPPGKGALFLINPLTGSQTLISSGNLLEESVGVVVESNGNLVVTDRVNGVVRVDPSTGAQTLLSAAGPSNDFFGIAINADGDFLVADSGLNPDRGINVAGKIILVDHSSGTPNVVAQGGNIVHPYGIAVDPIDGYAFVVSDISAFEGQGAIIRVDSSAGQHVVCGPAAPFGSANAPDVVQSPLLGCPFGILPIAFTYPAQGYGDPVVRMQTARDLPCGFYEPTPQVNLVPLCRRWQFPFGMDAEPSSNGTGYNIIVVDERWKAVYRLDPTTGGFATPPLFTPNGPTNLLVNPVGIAVLRFELTAGTPPTVSIVGAPATSPEGTGISLTNTVSPSDAYTYSWTVLKNGNPFTTGSAESLNFTPNDDGAYSVSLTVTGGSGPGTANANIAVTNVAPTVTMMGIPVSSSEGTAIALTSMASDPSTADTAAGFQYSWTVLKNGVGFASGSRTSLNFTPDDNGTYSVTLNITDKDGGTSLDNASITVTNVAPSVTINGAPASSDVGAAINLTNTVSDPSPVDSASGFNYAWSVTKNGNPYASGSAGSVSFTPDASGSYVVTLSVTDKDGSAGTASKTINVTDVPPTVSIVGAPASSPEGTAISLTNTVSPSGAYTYSWTVLKNGNPFTTGSAASLNFTPNDNGAYSVSLTVTGGSGPGTANANIAVTNVAPTVTMMGIPVSSSEGTAIALTSMASDPSTADTAAGFLYSWTVWKNGVGFASGSGTSLNFTPNDNGTYAVTLSVTDKDGGAGSVNTSIAVGNVAPVIPSGGVTGPTVPLALGTAATVVGNFTDVGTKDTHTCTFDWDDLLTSTVSGSPGVSETNGSGSCQATHSFAGPGVYNVGVTVTDDDGGSVTARVSQYVVVYDRAEGSVSGSGWINSLPGAYLPNPALVGKATFGFESKYRNGKTIPAGKTEFNFKVAKFKFKSTAYEWLVISGSKAQYTGSGVVKVHDASHADDENCEDENHWWQWTGDYSFILIAQDGALSDGKDKFRIKITDKATNAVIYDNRRRDSDDMDVANPQIISRGRITIKKH